MAGHDGVVGEQPLVLQREREAVQHLPAFLHFPRDECVFDELTDLAVTQAVQVELEQVLVFG